MQHISFLTCVVVASGDGVRCSAALPKQYLTIGAKPCLTHTVERIRQLIERASLEDRSQLIVVGNPQHRRWPAWLKDWPNLHSVAGGASRQESVQHALQAMERQTIFPEDVAVKSNKHWVLIHDGVRPCFDIDATLNLLSFSQAYDGGYLCYPLTDTLVELGQTIRAGAYELCQPRQRNNYRLVATPQLFTAQSIYQTYENRDRDTKASDDATLVTQAGFRLLAIESSPQNIKLTHPHDLFALENILSNHV